MTAPEIRYVPVEPPDLFPDDEPTPIGARIDGPARTTHAGLSILPWRELMANPPAPPPVLRPGLPEVGVTVLAGSPKVGKTLLACQWALELQRPVLLIVEEGSLAGIAFRLSRQASELGLDNPPVTVAHRQRIRLDNRSSVDRVRALVASLRPALVVMDPLNRLHGADENRPTQMTPVMDALAGIAYDFGTAVLCIHHLAKPSQERRGDVWDRFRGASSIRSGTDANLAMDGGSADRVRLVGEFRDSEPLSEYLELDREALLFQPADAPEAPSKVDPLALRAYVGERRQVTARQVTAEFSVAKNTALKALRALGCDEFPGVRGVLTFTLGTVQ